MNEKLVQLAQSQAEICGLFGNPYRLLILWVLSTKERSVSDIADEIGTSLQNTSQHLRLMRDKGLLASRRDGNVVYYHLQEHELLRGCRLLNPTIWRREQE